MQNDTHEEFLNDVESKLHDWNSRCDIYAAARCFKPRSIANMSVRGNAPAGGVLVGKRMMYSRRAVLEWLRAYLEKNATAPRYRADKLNTGKANHE